MMGQGGMMGRGGMMGQGYGRAGHDEWLPDDGRHDGLADAA